MATSTRQKQYWLGMTTDREVGKRRSTSIFIVVNFVHPPTPRQIYQVSASPKTASTDAAATIKQRKITARVNVPHSTQRKPNIHEQMQERTFFIRARTSAYRAHTWSVSNGTLWTGDDAGWTCHSYSPTSVASSESMRGAGTS